MKEKEARAKFRQVGPRGATENARSLGFGQGWASKRGAFLAAWQSPPGSLHLAGQMGPSGMGGGLRESPSSTGHSPGREVQSLGQKHQLKCFAWKGAVEVLEGGMRGEACTLARTPPSHP